MSSNTRLSDPRTQAAVLSVRHAGALRLLLVIVYLVLARLAGARNDGGLAALAIADIVAIVLLGALLRPRGWAWITLAACVIVLVPLAHSRWALLPLLLVPGVLIATVGYGFGRTLRHGRVPLITRMVAGLDAVPASALSSELRTYSRRLTAMWAGLLLVLALLNLLLACVAPNGLLDCLGRPLPLAWAPQPWLAGLLNTTIMCGFFVLEFNIRQRIFPGRYPSLLDFLRRMGRLGPDFWRDVMH
jgi:uncharacterized membrane protein